MKETLQLSVKGITSGGKMLDFCNILKILQSLVQQVLPVKCTLRTYGSNTIRFRNK